MKTYQDNNCNNKHNNNNNRTMGEGAVMQLQLLYNRGMMLLTAGIKAGGGV
jgi:hypothetical protein